MLSEIIVGLQTWIHQFFGCDFNVSVNSLFPLMISTWVFQYQKNTSTTTFLQLLEQRNQELQIFLCMWLFQLHVFHLETVFADVLLFIWSTTGCWLPFFRFSGIYCYMMQAPIRTELWQTATSLWSTLQLSTYYLCFISL